MTARPQTVVGPYTVTAQSWIGRSDKTRWAYVIVSREPGQPVFVSHYRYSTEAAAMARGIQDAKDSVAYHNTEGA